MGYIYKITNLINNKIYIGKTTKTIDIRFKQHLENAQKHKYKNSHLYNAINAYSPDNFKIELIEECDNTMLDSREIFWISYLNTLDPCIGYNIATGGDGGNTIAGMSSLEYTEHCNKLSKQQKDKVWFTNGQSEIKCLPGQEPMGWVQGRSDIVKSKLVQQANHIKDKWDSEKHFEYNNEHREITLNYWNNLSEESYNKVCDAIRDKTLQMWANISEDAKVHRIEKSQEKRRGRHWYNNGIENRMFFERDLPPGYIKGKLKLNNK